MLEMEIPESIENVLSPDEDVLAMTDWLDGEAIVATSLRLLWTTGDVVTAQAYPNIKHVTFSKSRRAGTLSINLEDGTQERYKVNVKTVERLAATIRKAMIDARAQPAPRPTPPVSRPPSISAPPQPRVVAGSTPPSADPYHYAKERLRRGEISEVQYNDIIATLKARK